MHNGTMLKRGVVWCAGVGATLVFARGAVAQGPVEATSTSEGRESVTITVYNQNFGLVREVRDVLMARGRVALEFGDVAARIQPETVHIQSASGDGLRVLEQNYQYDLLNPEKLLEKYVGRVVKVYRYNSQTGQEEEFDEGGAEEFDD